jgi:hypothetical protein
MVCEFVNLGKLLIISYTFCVSSFHVLLILTISVQSHLSSPMSFVRNSKPFSTWDAYVGITSRRALTL